MTSRPKYNQYLTSNRRQVPAGWLGYLSLTQTNRPVNALFICSPNQQLKQCGLVDIGDLGIEPHQHRVMALTYSNTPHYSGYYACRKLQLCLDMTEKHEAKIQQPLSTLHIGNNYRIKLTAPAVGLYLCPAFHNLHNRKIPRVYMCMYKLR